MLRRISNKAQKERGKVTLDLSNSNIGVIGNDLLIQSLRRAQGSFILDLAGSNIGYTSAVPLAEAIKEARVPITFELSDNNIGDIGVGVLAEAIRIAIVPLVLGLTSNNIGDKGAELLAETVKVVRVPFNLNLSHNKIGDRGVKFLAEAIRYARAPLTLDLGFNLIREIGIELLAQSLKQASVPLTLDLSASCMEEGGIRLIAQSLKVMRVPLNLNLSFNNIGNAGVQFLAEAIKEILVPLTLSLRDNKIGEAGVGLLSEAIKCARAPLTLDLSFNPIGEVGICLLAQNLEQANVPLSIDQNEADSIKTSVSRLIDDAMVDNFIVDARSNSSKFLSRIGSSFSRNILEQELDCPFCIAVLIQDYMTNNDIAWIEVAAIRAIEGASHGNKYSSINWKLLNDMYPGYFNNRQQPNKGLIADSVQEEKECNHTVSSSSVAAYENDVGSQEDSTVSSSSSSSVSGSGESDSAEFVCKWATEIQYLSGNAQPINYELKHNNANVYIFDAETLLKVLFAWIKDLSDEQQQKLLSSFSMRQMLELLEEIVSPHKLIANQLSAKPIEEIFTNEYQDHNDQEVFEYNTTQYARMSQQDSISIAISGGVILSNGMLIDPLPKYNHDLTTSYYFLA